MDTDQEIRASIVAAREGDADAVERLCAHLEPCLRDHVSRRMGPRLRRWTTPADLAQQVLFETMITLGRLPEGAGPEDVLRRLFQTANSRIKDAVRRHRRDVGGSVLAEGVEARAAWAASETGSVTHRDELRWLRALIERLPPKYRDIVRLCAVEGLSIAEVGERLDLAPDTVQKRYERARETLARMLPRRDAP